MKVSREISITDFHFWSGAQTTVKLLELEELKAIQEYIEEIEDEDKIIWTETMLNDFFWFETDWIAEFLGFKDFEDLYEKRSHKLI